MKHKLLKLSAIASLSALAIMLMTGCADSSSSAPQEPTETPDAPQEPMVPPLSPPSQAPNLGPMCSLYVQSSTQGHKLVEIYQLTCSGLPVLYLKKVAGQWKKVEF